MSYFKLLDYFRSIDGKKLMPGIECNSITANILTITNPNKDNTELKTVIKELKEQKTLLGIRKVIIKTGNARRFLNEYGYKEVQSQSILPGDFLIKPRKYFDDCVYCIDSTTFISVQPTDPQRKETTQVVIKNNVHITPQHKIYRKGNQN